MTWKRPFRRAFPALTALAAWAAVATTPIAAADPVWRANSDYCVEIEGAYAPDARVFVSDTRGSFLVDLPSLSIGVLMNVKSRKVVRFSRWSLKYDGADGSVRLADGIPPDAPSSELYVDAPIGRFKIDASEVSVQKSSACRATVKPYWTGLSVTDDLSARRCLRQEARPIAATAGCTKVQYLKNTCNTPVVAVVRTTQHLFSGVLPETSSIVVPPGGEYSLGCVWSSGASAPSEFDLLAAAFPPKPPVPEAGDRGAARP